MLSGLCFKHRLSHLKKKEKVRGAEMKGCVRVVLHSSKSCLRCTSLTWDIWKIERSQKEDQQTQQISWGPQTSPWKLQVPFSSSEVSLWPLNITCGLQQKSEGRGMLSERSHLVQRDPDPVATRRGSCCCWTLPVEIQGRKPPLPLIITRK